MSLLSNFLGTENYDFMESPMFRELIENLKQEAAEEKNKFVTLLILFLILRTKTIL